MIKEILKVVGAIIVAFGILFLISFSSWGNRDAIPKTSNQAQVINTQNVQATSSETYSVSRVIDGDTIVVNIHGTDETIRLIGVNTPETVDPRKKVQCFGKEASNFVKAMLLPGTLVRLEADLTQDDKDKYGRLLRYVYLGDILVNEEIISAGYGFEYTYDIPYQYQVEFKASQAFAESGSLGLWAKDTCNGQLKDA